MRLIVRDPALPLLVGCILLRLPVVKMKPKVSTAAAVPEPAPVKGRPPAIQSLFDRDVRDDLSYRRVG